MSTKSATCASTAASARAGSYGALASDGTLRLLALTIPAYLPDLEGVFLIEEPENGIHPRAIETVLQSLSSIYDGQVLLATHSPVALNMLNPKEVLCFAKDETGATDIISGNLHPALRDWKQGEPSFGVLFAAAVALAGCNTMPIQNVSDAPVVSASGRPLSHDQVRSAMRQAGLE